MEQNLSGEDISDLNAQSRKHCFGLIGYFDRTNRDYPDSRWVKGSEIARRWLALIDSQSPTQPEVTALLEVILANRGKGSGWLDLFFGAVNWAKTNGFETPPKT